MAYFYNKHSKQEPKTRRTIFVTEQWIDLLLIHILLNSYNRRSDGGSKMKARIEDCICDTDLFRWSGSNDGYIRGDGNKDVSKSSDDYTREDIWLVLTQLDAGLRGRHCSRYENDKYK